MKSMLDQDKMMHADCFRIRQADGSYAWMRFDAVEIHLDHHSSMLLCVQPLVIETRPGARDCLKAIADAYGLVESPELSNKTMCDAVLWRSFAAYDRAGLFWKDREQRFLGANEAFLDFFGFHGEAEIVGRTDHELGLHIVDPAVRLAGEKLLRDGQPQYHQFGECIARGSSHAIYSDRYPIYREGRIIGLIGRFRELGHELDEYRDVVMDKETGFTNYRGRAVRVLHESSAAPRQLLHMDVSQCHLGL